MIIGAVEAGGSKFVCGLFAVDGTAKPTLTARAAFPTGSPAQTLAAARGFFEAQGRYAIDRIGVGCFGPVDLRPGSPTWGRIGSTPKQGWQGIDVAGFFQSAFDLPLAFDTDVNAAACGEQLWGAARGIRDFVYLTVGTGIGGGVYANGLLVHGQNHPELGHIKIARERGDDFAGVCPYHRDCLEGLASGPAMATRWGAKAESLPSDHPAWELEARYLARAIAAYACVLFPERVLVGGGVGLVPGLAERVAALVGQELAGYLEPLAEPGRLGEFVVRPALGADAGLFGAAALALRLGDI